MLLQRQESKQYLYTQQASKQGHMVVDVSRANQPTLLDRIAQANVATAVNLQVVAPDVALAETPEKSAGTVNSLPRPAESVRVLDINDPAHPTTFQTFEGVTSILPDRGHVYLVNGEGL